MPGMATICQLLHRPWRRRGGGPGGAAGPPAPLATHRFVFACLDELGPLGEELRSEGFPVHVLGRRPGVDWRCARRLARLLRASAWTWCTPTSTPRSSTASRPGCSVADRRCLFTEHGRWYPRLPAPEADHRQPPAARAARPCRRRRPVGPAGADSQRGDPGRPGRGHLQRHRPGGLLRRRPATARRPAARSGSATADLVIIQVARLDSLKDHATAIRDPGTGGQQRPDGPTRPRRRGPGASRRSQALVARARP